MGVVEREAVVEDSLKEGGGGGVVVEVVVVGSQGPRLPRQLFTMVQFVDKVREEDHVLLMKLPHHEPSNLFRQTNLDPSN
jgi:hypothetical protein